MKKALYRLLNFFICMTVVDCLMGNVFSYLKANAKSGVNIDNKFIKDSVNADVLVFGSSRSLRHYDPYLIADSLDLSCYICGMNSNGIITNFARFQSIMKRYTPKIIIYDIMPSFDVAKEDNSKYVQQLRENGNDGFSPNMISIIDPFDKIKSLSKMYRNNSSLFSLIVENQTIPENRNKGYHPYKDSMRYESNFERSSCTVDSLKLDLFKKMIIESKRKGVLLAFFVSPAYKKDYYSSTKPIELLCRKEGIPFFNDNFVHGISDHRDNFHDSVHLNEAGSEKYTKLVIKQIKGLSSK